MINKLLELIYMFTWLVIVAIMLTFMFLELMFRVKNQVPIVFSIIIIVYVVAITYKNER